MLNLNKLRFLFFLLGTGLTLNAQNEFSKWYFGNNAGLDFSTQPPTVLTTGSLNSVEGVATISDANGNLLFYAHATQIYNNLHAPMANGGGLLGDMSSTQASIIVQQPGSNSIYYLFSTKGNGYHRYSIVDMSLAAGLGSVTVKNATLYTPTCEKQVAVRHCNGKDVWILSHHYGSNQFRAYLLSSNGISPSPVVSAIGEAPSGGLSTLGQMKVSPDGKKLAVASMSNSVPNSLGLGGFHLFDFDASTGVVSNSLALLSGNAFTMGAGPYGVEFSPDGKKVYGATSPGAVANSTCSLFQWDICSTNTTAIIASQYSFDLTGPFVGSLQRAIDGKIYLALGQLTQSLSVINNPNASGAAMNFVQGGLSIAPGSSHLGLPNFINTYTRVAPSPFSSTVTCQNVTFSVPPVPSFSSGCSTMPYPPSSYLWNFGDPASGAANSSTLTNPIHTYSMMGTYTVSLILYSNCTNDTLKKVITISTPGPTLSVNGNSLICKGAKTVYTVSGGSTYQWSNNTAATTATFSPNNTTVYSVTATLNGCSASKLFTVTVDPCTGIASFEKNDRLHIFPNPVNDVLMIEATEAASVLLFDMSGTLVLERKVEPGMNELNTSDLIPGIYTIQAKHENGVWRGRLVKME